MKFYRSHQLIRPDLQAHIYSQALLENVKNLRSLCTSETKFCAVVKSNAYGHGVDEVVNILKKANVDFFAVASIYEAIHIEPMLKKQPILIFEPVNSSQPQNHIILCAKKGFHCAISSHEGMDFLVKTLTGTKLVINLHLNVESGMGRFGLLPKYASELIDMIDNCPNAKLTGVYTHFATADEEDISYDLQQLNRFNRFLEEKKLISRNDLLIHAANSAATIKMPDAHFDMVRCGIAMYGYYSRQMPAPPIQLQPIMKLEAPIIHLKHIPAENSVSYGRSFIPNRDTTIATVPLGYADGYWRCFSNRSKLKVKGQIVPVVGRVCMDQLLVDVTDVTDVAIGQTVTIIDNDHDSPCGVYQLAKLADTICYEILTCMHAHVNRTVH